MFTKNQRMRFILEDEPDRLKKEYNEKNSILNIYQNTCEQYPILNDGKPKQKVITKFYKRG